jgi:hypothetical protein
MNSLLSNSEFTCTAWASTGNIERMSDTTNVAGLIFRGGIVPRMLVGDQVAPVLPTGPEVHLAPSQ